MLFDRHEKEIMQHETTPEKKAEIAIKKYEDEITDVLSRLKKLGQTNITFSEKFSGSS